MSGREPRAVLLVLALAALGHAARAWLGRPGSPPGDLLAPPSAGSGDPLRQRERALAVARPLAPGELVDLNTARAEEIARLPRIGMSLAKQIVTDRDARGPFGGPGDLDRVPGVGPGTIALLAGRVRFSGQPGPPASGEGGANPSTSRLYAGEQAFPSARLMDLNSASEADLATLPGIGRSRALAIVAYRRDAGPFAAVSDLGRVRGISRALVRRLAPLLTVR
jgi:competence protein ComEA